MIEKVRINYRDFDASSFDINVRDLEKETEYKELLSQAFKAIPQNDTEREILDDYIKTLKQIISYQDEINEIRTLIHASPSYTLQGTEELKKTAAHKAACIYSREQELSVIRSLDSNLLGKVLARSNYERESKQESLRVSKRSVEEAIKAQEKKGKISKTQEQTSHNFLLFRTILMSMSLVISLATLDTPILLICAITFLVFTPLIFASPTYAVVLYCIYDIARPILYAWAFIVTVQGKQDIFAIAFYILMALQAISMIKRLIGTIGIIVLALNGDKE